MAIPARLLRTFLPALVGAGLVLAACSSDSDDPGPDTNPPTEGGSDSSGGGTSGAPAEPQAGSPAGGSGGSGGTGGTGGAAAGGETDPGTGGTPTEPGGGGAGGSDDGPPEPTESFLNGKKTYDEKCALCHQADLGGLGAFANISPHPEYGIASLTDDEVIAAITTAAKPGGGKLCGLMDPFPEITGTEMSELLEFLRGSAPVARQSSVCTVPAD